MISLLRRLVLFAIAAFLLLLLGCAVIIYAGWQDDRQYADLAVVLGSKVQLDGQPCRALQARLDHAADLYRQGYFKLVLVSGAHGKEGYDEPRVMRHYLEAHGVPHDTIFEDNTGYTTWATAKNTAAFLKEHQLTSVLVISQYFHLPRCRLAFAKFGLTNVHASPAPFWTAHDFISVPREVVAYLVYDLRSAG